MSLAILLHTATIAASYHAPSGMAEDAAQEAFLTMIEEQKPWEAPQIRQAARNKARKLYRRERRRAASSDVERLTTAPASTLMEDLSQSLAKMPTAHRLILNALIIDGDTQEAYALAGSLLGAKSLRSQQRAVARIRQTLAHSLKAYSEA